MGIAIEFGPDTEFNAVLLSHPATFLAFQHHSNREQIIKLIISEGGQFKTFNQWYKEVKDLVGDYDKKTLNIEFNTAVSSARMVLKWRGFQRRKATYPNLKYITHNDDCVRHSHRPLHGIIRPVDDPFWDVFFPPNGWGCRCDIQQTDEPVSGSSEDLEVDGTWCFNVGKKNVRDVIEGLGLI